MLIYRIFSILILPLLAPYLLIRIIKKKEDKNRFQERFGFATKQRPEGRVIWLHAVSVGEVNSAFSLISELLSYAENISILLTTTTLTSAKIAATKLPEFRGRVTHQFLPFDSYFCVKKFLNFWRPRVAIFIESEIWPNLIFEARKQGVLSFLVNARMSEKSRDKWQLARKFGFKIFDNFAAIFVQKKSDEEVFKSITDQEVLFYGNLKSQAQDLAFDQEKLAQLKAEIGQRKFWLAASTHKGEEEIVISVHHELKKDFPDLLTIIVPRHPNRAEEIKSLLSEINFAQRSKHELITNTTEIYLADSLNEMGIFYRLANFAFIAGSLVDVGGHNPYEPVKLGCAVISGSRVFNSQEIYDKLSAQNACVMINSQEELVMNVRKLLRDQDEVRRLSSKASQVISESEDLENIAKKIVKKIDQMVMVGV